MTRVNQLPRAGTRSREDRTPHTRCITASHTVTQAANTLVSLHCLPGPTRLDTVWTQHAIQLPRPRTRMGGFASLPHRLFDFRNLCQIFREYKQKIVNRETYKTYTWDNPTQSSKSLLNCSNPLSVRI